MLTVVNKLGRTLYMLQAGTDWLIREQFTNAKETSPLKKYLSKKILRV